MKALILPPNLKQYRLPGVLCIFCVLLLAIRMKLTHSLFLAFLVWNLFLAAVPLAISQLIINSKTLHKRLYLYPLLVCWLLFLPNALYLITDFVHLYKDNSIPVWFDILLIATFSFTGMLFGLQSMYNIYLLAVKRNGLMKSRLFMMAVCLLCGFGIYLGRYLRYNSWDALHRPFALLNHSFAILFDAETYRAAWGITLGFGVLQYLMFSIYRDSKN